MRFHAGAPPGRRRFLALSAGGAMAGAAALSGCAMQVSTGVSGSGRHVTVMANAGDVLPELIQRAKKDIGIKSVKR